MINWLIRRFKRMFGFGPRVRVIEVQKKIFVRTRSNKIKRLSRIFIRVRKK